MADILTIDQYSHPELFFKAIRDSLEMTGTLKIKVRGLSMAPVIKDSEVILLERIDGTGIRKGDIIFFRGANNRFIAHRVIAKKTALTFVTKGDNALFIDAEFPYSDILGIVRKVVRDGRAVELDKNPVCRLIGLFNVRFCHIAIFLTSLAFKIRCVLGGIIKPEKNYDK